MCRPRRRLDSCLTTSTTSFDELPPASSATIKNAARDILETLTGGRIDMFQQGEPKPMHGWLQGRFTVRLLDVLVEKLAGVRRVDSGEVVEVVIEFKCPRKTDTDADEAIRQWLDGRMNKEIAEALECVPSYVTRLLKLGAQRLGTTVEALRSQRKTRPAEVSKIPKYKAISDEVKTLWWEELYPVAIIAKRLLCCSTVTVEAAKRWWYESRGMAVPTFEEWSLELERRVLELFDADELTVGRDRRPSPSGSRHRDADCKRSLPATWTTVAGCSDSP